MLDKDDMDKLDAEIIRQLVAKQMKIDVTDKDLGEQAYSWFSAPIMKIQAIKGRGGKKAPPLRFAEIVNLCEALGLSWVDVCREALECEKNKK